MSEPVEPGARVVCIDARPDRITGAACPLVLGATYFVEYVWCIPDQRDGRWAICYDLVGVPRMKGDLAYNADRFKRLGPPRADKPRARGGRVTAPDALEHSQSPTIRVPKCQRAKLPPSPEVNAEPRRPTSPSCSN